MSFRSIVAWFRAVIAVGLLLGFAAAANASIIYDVDRTIGAGTVTGFVETDGTLGVLASGNFTDWVLTLTAPNLRGGSPDVISFATQAQTLVVGTATTATSSQLLFDFSSGNNIFIFQGGGSDNNFWCFASGQFTCGFASNAEILGRAASSGNATEIQTHSGVVAFATVTSVPEPATLAIFAFGLAGLGFMTRRRRGGVTKTQHAS